MGAILVRILYLIHRLQLHELSFVRFLQIAIHFIPFNGLLLIFSNSWPLVLIVYIKFLVYNVWYRYHYNLNILFLLSLIDKYILYILNNAIDALHFPVFCVANSYIIRSVILNGYIYAILWRFMINENTKILNILVSK